MKIALIVISLTVLIPLTAYLFKSLSNNNPTNIQSPLSITNTKSQTTGKVPDIPLKLPSGFSIYTFAEDLGKPRDLQFSPGGTLLVSNPDSNEIIALPDKNGDGQADDKKVIIRGENHPHGLAFYNNKLYVADVDKVVRYNWDEASLTATKDKVLFDLPQNNNHNNRTITFDKNGRMYVSVGSTCNVCIEKSGMSATVMTADADGNNLTTFAKGLRNAPFIKFNPNTNELWATEMGRDNLGDNLPPDEINIVRSGKDFGWPFCYANKLHDDNFDPSNTRKCNETESPIFEIPAHSAPLGLTFINSPLFPSDWQGDLLIALHGSWNRTLPIGYKVIHLKVSGNTITNSEDFITGFIPDDARSGSDSKGRPVDLEFDKDGNLYLSDDKSGSVYIIKRI